MVDVRTKLVYIDVSGQTQCYRGGTVETF